MTMIMPSNQSHAHDLGEQFPGRIGMLFSPGGERSPKRLPYALDNGAFGAWKQGLPFDELAWLSLLDWSNRYAPPKWALVPDTVGHRPSTLLQWAKYYPVVHGRGLIPAFAVQDGMVARDVPKEAHVIFVGGSTEWKWDTAEMWCKSFPRVHVARVNTVRKLRLCAEWGAESVDGTGWFHHEQRAGLIEFLSGQPLGKQTTIFEQGAA